MIPLVKTTDSTSQIQLFFCSKSEIPLVKICGQVLPTRFGGEICVLMEQLLSPTITVFGQQSFRILQFTKWLNDFLLSGIVKCRCSLIWMLSHYPKCEMCSERCRLVGNYLYHVDHQSIVSIKRNTSSSLYWVHVEAILTKSWSPYWWWLDCRQSQCNIYLSINNVDKTYLHHGTLASIMNEPQQ